jgi:hypothetical protein
MLFINDYVLHFLMICFVGRKAAVRADTPTRGRRGQAAALTAPPLSPPEEPTGGRGRGRGRGAPKKAPELANEDEESLYSIILSGKHSLQVGQLFSPKYQISNNTLSVNYSLFIIITI